MNEKYLQHIWYYKKFSNTNFHTSEGESIEILDFGEWNMNAGPDFLFAKIKIGTTILAGNIEIHVKSSDWYFHQHSGDLAYNNVILHVVYTDDMDIGELRDKNVPTLILKNYIDESSLDSYSEKSFIPCEHLFTPSKIPAKHEEQVLLQKLEAKTIIYKRILERNKNNFEALLFQQLAYVFGLKVNAEIFHQMAYAIDYGTINKIRQNKVQLEALFYGMCGWLEEPVDSTMELWNREFRFLQSKFTLLDVRFSPKFSRLRPANFPTIRLSQLANLYAEQQNLFSIMIQNPDYQNIRTLLSALSASDYWTDHFSFGKMAQISFVKKLSPEFINLLFINCILPLQYFFQQLNSESKVGHIIDSYRNIPPEKNHIIKHWENLGIEFQNSLQTQAFLYQYKTFCKAKKCLNCAVGFQILKNAEQHKT
ncbi:hypothetical protein CMT89_13595 [Elizabethkingia anophelis]|uniref:DUF2851 family protein n=1 Tax=Elizabethkingia anophelis TaxID=1117645 RepID=UPI000CE9580D|nr:DUF2851 family protein [Elizabethkingia anophelis]AVF47884.1 DUF2851 domain-containing protein [Elizabethkingia anophelis]AVF51876.1 DUF2851 domain-containing protein [Elizabethkingia anophelis]MBG0505481.1 DUF2851 family protein [Elizabethkingia anophelis]MCT4074342.1 DUF2851 family protein [Elizabethkingia anophelis]MDV3902218.1 hypothetical protein [Elizabethkingia anophelis]